MIKNKVIMFTAALVTSIVLSGGEDRTDSNMMKKKK